MKLRLVIWAATGFLVASGWAVYFLARNKDLPIEPVVSSLILDRRRVSRRSEPIQSLAGSTTDSRVTGTCRARTPPDR